MHCLPRTVVSENGLQFVSAEFKQFMNANGIRHVKVAPYHPASNGQAERAVRIFKEGIEKMQGGSLKSKLCRFLLRYRVINLHNCNVVINQGHAGQANASCMTSHDV